MTELYKVHRPRSLDRIVGNDETVASIRSMLEKKTVPHTILFSGPSGAGKTTLARILRRELGCHDLDFVEMNCSSFRGIDTVRDIMRVMELAPAAGPCRVWILDEVHQMSKDGQNAALKMLEDTPSHVYFFLCTTDPQKIIPTIRTRCTKMPVRQLTPKELDGLLARVAKKEGIKVSADILGEISGLANGSARAALVMLNKIQHLPVDKHSDAIKVKEDDERDAIELCRALIKKEKWDKITRILKGITADPEQVRWSVLGYARSVLLGSKNPQAYMVITAFEDPWYDSKEAGLIRACYESIFG